MNGIQTPSKLSTTDSTLPSIRTATISRKTNETDIQVSISLDQTPGTSQLIEVHTGIGFLDHVIRHLRFFQ